MIYAAGYDKVTYIKVDVVAVLTDSVDPTAYWRKLKQRLKNEGNETVTNCHGLKMTDSVVMDVLVRIRMAFGCGMDDVVEIER